MRLKYCLIVLGCGLLFGCAKTQQPGDRSRYQEEDFKHVDTLNFYGKHVTPEKEQELLSENIVYFGYDQDNITHRYELVLLAHTKKLLDNPDLKLRIDGHTDERGSAEYNIALGERRAKAVMRFIELKGIPNYRLIVVSYGKEKPAVIGRREEAWRLNRRAELHYE